ncbi:MAG: 16S rRNA (guanine(527)-N(7))-methyltransferase RsmG [Pseudohongiellaceae bacterium]
MAASPADTLRHGLDQLGLDYTPAMHTNLLAYLALLEKWNKTYNLIGTSKSNDGAGSPSDDTASGDNSADISNTIVSHHLLDSAAINHLLRGHRLLDVGTGAGLPGIPLAILNPNKHFILLDSNGKKTRFLQQAQTDIPLPNIQIEKCRIENYKPHEQINMMLCRAFAPLPELLNKVQTLTAAGVPLLAMKGHHPQQEIDALPQDCTIQHIEKLSVPSLKAERHAIMLSHSPMNEENP